MFCGVSIRRSCLTVILGCGTVLLVASVVLLHSRGRAGVGSNSSKQSLPSPSCLVGPRSGKTHRIALLPAKEEPPLSDAEDAGPGALGAAAGKQTPSAECNRGLARLVQRNHSDISVGGAFGLSKACIHLLLDKQVSFVSEATRVRLMSKSLGPWNTSHCFRRAILESEKEPIQRRLAMVKKEFDRAGIPLILDGGTLVGSYRHHGFVPWDDDFDFRISYTDSVRAYKIFAQLAKLHPKMFRFWPKASSTHWKFYIIDLRLRKAEVTNFLLCLDIFFYHDAGPKSSASFNLTDRWTLSPRKLFFPLTTRPFEGIWFPAPADTYGYLNMYYGDVIDGCVYHCYSNLKSVRNCKTGDNWISCSKMHYRYPFVRRVFIGNTGASLEFQLLDRYLMQTVFLSGHM